MRAAGSRAMQNKPVCPKYGGTDGTLVSSHSVYAAADISRIGPPIGIRTVIKCTCGTAFTDLVQEPDSVEPRRDGGES
jgi:hypothetical protein